MLPGCLGPDRDDASLEQVAAEDYWPIEQSPFAPAETPRYVLYPGDVLQVRFPSDPELDTQVPVRSDGKVTVPHVGDVMAAGREPMELARDLEQRMEGVLTKELVTVIVAEESGRRIYVGGDVRQPGSQLLRAQQTLSQALFEAGGVPGTAAMESILVLRHRPDANYVLKADLNRIVHGEAPDVPLEPFDVIFVPETIITKVDRAVDQFVNALVPRSVSFPFITEIRSAPVRVINGNQSTFPVSISR